MLIIYFLNLLILSFSTNKNILQLNNYEFNDFIEKIRVILAENKYILKIDEESFTEALIESKKTTDFNYFLKKVSGGVFLVRLLSGL